MGLDGNEENEDGFSFGSLVDPQMELETSSIEEPQASQDFWTEKYS